MADVVGVTIQQRSVRGVEARISRTGACTVLRTAEVEVDPAVFDTGRLVDAKAFSLSLGALWERGGFKSKRVELVIDGRLAVVRRTELPSLGASQLRQAAAYDISELLSYPISEAVFDVDEIEQFERNGTTWAKALAVAVEESALLELKGAVAAAGLRLIGTPLAAEALARGVSHETPVDAEDPTHRPVAILDCEDASTNIVIRDHSGVLFARTLGVGVGESTISVADELESALAQLSGGETDESEDLVGGSSAGVSAVVESIRRTLSYYTAELDDRPLAAVTVAGSRGQASGLLAALETTLGLPASTAPSAAEWPNDQPMHGFETPIGAAIGAAESRTRHLVLTSDRERTKQSKRRSRAAALATGLPAVAFVATSVFGAWNDVTAARTDADQAEATTETLALRLAELDSTAERVTTWQTAVDSVESIEGQQLRLDLVVAELAASMPADTNLLSIEMQRGSVGDLPPGYSGPTPAGIISISGIADDIDGVSRWLANASSSEVLDGVWLEQSTVGPIGADGELGALFSAKGVITEAARPSHSIVDADLLDAPTASESDTNE